jgi:hypothetical protein
MPTGTNRDQSNGAGGPRTGGNPDGDTDTDDVLGVGDTDDDGGTVVVGGTSPGSPGFG